VGAEEIMAERASSRAVGSPTEVLRSRWRPVLREVKGRASADKVPLVAAGVAFYAMLALFPALIAAVSIFGLAVDAEQVEGMMAQLGEMMPQSASALLKQQLRRIVETSESGLGLGLVVSLVVALWSASTGMTNIDKAMSVVYDVDTRSFLRGRLVALGLTLGAIVLLGALLALIIAVPAVLALVPLGAGATVAVQIGRWLAIALVACLGLIGLYAIAPNRERRPGWRWTVLGAVTATILWLVASALFSFYVSTFGTYNETYGALGGGVVLLLWFWLTALAVLLGGELNAALEAHGSPFSPSARRRAAPSDIPRDSRTESGQRA
jgi:membrane protein